MCHPGSLVIHKLTSSQINAWGIKGADIKQYNWWNADIIQQHCSIDKANFGTDQRIRQSNSEADKTCECKQQIFRFNIIDWGDFIGNVTVEKSTFPRKWELPVLNCKYGSEEKTPEAQDHIVVNILVLIEQKSLSKEHHTNIQERFGPFISEDHFYFGSHQIPDFAIMG